MYTRLTKAIKAAGYSTEQFAKEKLGLKYATMAYRIRAGRLALEDYHKILFYTGKRFEDLFPNPMQPRQVQSHVISRRDDRYEEVVRLGKEEHVVYRGVEETKDRFHNGVLVTDDPEIIDILREHHMNLSNRPTIGKAIFKEVEIVREEAPPVVEPPREPALAAPVVLPSAPVKKKFKAIDLSVPIVEPGEPNLEIPQHEIKPGIALPGLAENAFLQE